MDQRRAGTGYLALPETGGGPGILVLHAWWGLKPFFRELCDRLAAEGFVALAPDLFDGQVTDSVEDAARLLEEADPNELAHLTRSSLRTLRNLPATPAAPVGVLGFSMGASLGLWLSVRVPEGVAATTAFYGGQDIDFAGSTSAYLGHYAEEDPFVDEDGLVLLEADLHLLGLETSFHRYPGTAHWFFEDDRPEHDPAAAQLAWDRTLAFFREHLEPTQG
ncbi:MAG: dienelactone hydrolase family protein [Acidimicrobiales bacterium]|nr:dienelactone hydrolase family protein [Acidimicrobiales bacterium]